MSIIRNPNFRKAAEFHKMEIVKHETCVGYLRRRLSEGWKCIEWNPPYAVLLSPWGYRRVLDLRNDIETLRPNADAECNIDYPVGPDHYAEVDEEVADEDSTLVYQEVAAFARDLYNLPAHTGSGTINKITVYTCCYLESTGPPP